MQQYPTPTTDVPPPPRPTGRVTRPRTQQFALFIAAIAWYFCALALAASASSGIAFRLNLADTQPLLEAAFQLFLIILGFAILRTIERRRMPLSMALGLPRRVTSRAEWSLGAAIGWGLAIAAILPMAVARSLNVQLWTTPRAFELFALSLATLALGTLAHALAIYGYGFQRLIEAIGPTRAVILIAILSAIRTGFVPAAYDAGIVTMFVIAILTSVLLSLSWIRTHGLWLLWGLQFALSASIAALFGLPLGGNVDYSSIVETRTHGPAWLTGSTYGPGGAFLTILFLLIAIPILIRATSDYAWDYTRPPLIPAGYDVTIAPPAAHVAMEQAALQSQPVNPASLVQILPAPPSNPPE